MLRKTQYFADLSSCRDNAGETASSVQDGVLLLATCRVSDVILECKCDLFDREVSCCDTNRIRVSEMRRMAQRSLCEVPSMYSEVAWVFEQE